MVALDHVCIPLTGLNYVRVDGALRQEVLLGDAEAFRLVPEHITEFRTDDVSLFLGIFHPCQLAEESLLRIDPDKVYVPLCKCGLYFIPFVFAHQTVIHKYAGQPLPDGFRQQGSQYGGIHAAGQCQQHPAIRPDLVPERLYSCLAEIAHGPVSGAAADLFQEVVDHADAELGVVDLRMELYRIQLLLLVFHGCNRAVLGVGGGTEACWQLGNIIRMAHPGDGLFRHVLDVRKQQAGRIVGGFRLAVFRGDAGSHLAPQGIRHQLTAVADSQDRDTQLKNLRADPGGGVVIHAVGAAGENDAHGRKGAPTGFSARSSSMGVL